MVLVEEAMKIYFLSAILVGVIVCITSGASSEEQLVKRSKRQNDMLVPEEALKSAEMRAEMVAELEELQRMEAAILLQLENLSVERDRIQARKRGIHTQCFLNICPNDMLVPKDALKSAEMRAEMVAELEELQRMEAAILLQLENLSVERDRIQARKRGIHTQCFLNLVSCYKRR